MAKQLADAGYRVFVVGFGASMPDVMKNTLNWMAYHGNADDPSTANAANPYAYDPSLVATCQISTTTPASCSGMGYNCYAETNDPGNLALSGYAFITSSPDELTGSPEACRGDDPRGQFLFLAGLRGILPNPGRKLPLRRLLPAHHGRSFLARPPEEVRHQQRRYGGCCHLGRRQRSASPERRHAEHQDAHRWKPPGVHNIDIEPSNFGITDDFPARHDRRVLPGRDSLQ